MKDRLIRPDGGIRFRGGGLAVPGGGLVRPVYAAAAAPPPAGYSLDTLTPTQIATIMGIAEEPDHMWLGKNASGATDIAGTDDLSDAGSPGPIKEVTDATLGGTCTTFGDSGDLNRMEAANNSVMDIGIKKVAILYIGRLISNLSGSFDNLVCKSLGSVGASYSLLQETTNRIEFFHWTSAGFHHQIIGVDHGFVNAQVILMVRETGATTRKALFTREGSSDTSPDPKVGTITSASKFMIGDAADHAGVGVSNNNFGCCCAWLDTNVPASFGESERLAVAEALGYE